MSVFDPREPRLREKLDGRRVGAAWFALGSAALVEIVSRHGPDAVVIDMQHGLFDRLSLEAAIAASSAPVLVRTRDAAPASIGEALDAGAEGVLVPLVETGEAAAAVAKACRYPPDGHRSGGGVRPLADFAAQVELANAGIVAGVMIETRLGVENAEAIARSGVDLVFIGTGDLALSLGTAPGSEAHQSACLSVLAACRSAGVPCGVFAMSAEAAAARVAEGFAFTVPLIDMNVFEAGAKAELAHFAHAAKPPRRRGARRRAGAGRSDGKAGKTGSGTRPLPKRTR